MTIYTVNVSKRVDYIKEKDVYKHHFRVETDKIALEGYEDNLIDFLKELRTLYKKPQYNITVWKNIEHKQEVDI